MRTIVIEAHASALKTELTFSSCNPLMDVIVCNSLPVSDDGHLYIRLFPQILSLPILTPVRWLLSCPAYTTIFHPIGNTGCKFLMFELQFLAGCVHHGSAQFVPLNFVVWSDLFGFEFLI